MKNIELNDDDLLDIASTGRMLDIQKLVEIAYQKTVAGARDKQGGLNNQFSITSGMQYVKELHPTKLPNGVKALLEKRIDAVHAIRKDRHKSYWRNEFFPKEKHEPYEERKKAHMDALLHEESFIQFIGERSRFLKAMVIDIEKLYLKAGIKPPKIDLKVYSAAMHSFSDDSMSITNRVDGSVLIQAKMPADILPRIYWNDRLVLFGASYWHRPVVFDLVVKRGKKGQVLSSTLRVAQPAENGRCRFTQSTRDEVFVMDYVTQKGSKKITQLRAKKVEFRLSSYEKETMESFKYWISYNDTRMVKRFVATFTNERSQSHDAR